MRISKMSIRVQLQFVREHFSKNENFASTSNFSRGGGRVVPYLSYTGTCRPSGVWFFDPSLINRVSN